MDDRNYQNQEDLTPPASSVEEAADSTPRPAEVTIGREALPVTKLEKVQRWVATAVFAAVTAGGLYQIYSNSGKVDERYQGSTSYQTVDKISPLMQVEQEDKRVEQMQNKRVTLSLSKDNKTCTVTGKYPEAVSINVISLDDPNNVIALEGGPGTYSRKAEFEKPLIKGCKVEISGVSGKKFKIDTTGDGDIYGQDVIRTIEESEKTAPDIKRKNIGSDNGRYEVTL
jgi:hypothetical protein